MSRYIEEVPKKLTDFSDEELSERPAPNKWSKKEILGHLCDSAVNNLSRFIRAQIEEQPFRDGNTFTLGWLVEDYVEHREHHLRQIFVDNV